MKLFVVVVERRCRFSLRQALAKRYGRIVVTIASEVPRGTVAVEPMQQSGLTDGHG
jgi:hypothetical protein